MEKYIQNYVLGEDIRILSSSECGSSGWSRTGYDFSNWYDADGATFNANDMTSFSTATKDLSANWTAHEFKLSVVEYANGTVTVKDKESGATISPGDNVKFNQAIFVEATPETGYSLTRSKLTIDGNEVQLKETEIANTLSAIVNKDATVGKRSALLSVVFSGAGVLTYWKGYE